MVEVVNNGTAKCCMQLANGIQAAAKTGTAQLNPEGQPPASHAWIIAFAPAGAAPLRRRGDGQGDARGDGRDRRDGGRPDRQAGPRLRPRPRRTAHDRALPLRRARTVTRQPARAHH